MALCLYRIAQESLNNIVKHSGTKRAAVSLAIDGSEVVLNVVDDGVGFEPQSVRQKEELGLVSMRERVRLVRGNLTVSSKKGEGTKVQVRVPVTMPAST